MGTPAVADDGIPPDAGRIRGAGRGLCRAGRARRGARQQVEGNPHRHFPARRRPHVFAGRAMDRGRTTRSRSST
jgi:hypothetical protein